VGDGQLSNRTTGWNASDQACFDAFAKWHVSIVDAIKLSGILTSTTTDESIFRISEGVGKGYTYMECDGIPRFRFHSHPTSTTSRTVTATFRPRGVDIDIYWGAIYAETILGTPVPVPRCSVEDEHCKEYRSLYRSERLKSIGSAPGPDDFDYAKSAHLFLEADRGCALLKEQCKMDVGEEVVLIYWPPLLVSRNICAANGYGTAVTQTEDSPESGPLVVTTDAITFHGLDVEPLLSEGGAKCKFYQLPPFLTWNDSRI
jgi:hypothetical protein